MNGRPWTVEEMAALVACDRRMAAYEALATRLGRSVSAIQSKRLKIDRRGKPWRRWTPQEDAVVRRYARHVDETLAALPGRTHALVMQRLRILAERESGPAR